MRNDLTNVQGSPTDGQVLTYVLTDGKWEPKNAVFTAALSTLSDVSVTDGDAINGQALAWDKVSVEWKAKAFLTTIPSFMSLPGVESPAELSANWVAVYDQTNNALTFARPTSLITVSSLNQVGDVSYPVGGVGAIPSGASLVWNGATWAPSSVAPATIGITGIINGPGAMHGSAGKIIRVNSVESAWEYMNPSAAFGLTLSTLGDVQITEGGGIDGYTLVWKQVDGKWEAMQLAAVATSGACGDLAGEPSLATIATSGAYGDLTGKPTIPTNGSFALAALSDVSMTPGAGVDDHVVYWDNGPGKFKLKAAASGGSGGSATLAALTDVNVTEGAGIDGKYLKWDNAASKWVAATASSGGGGTLAGDSDVSISAPTAGQVLAYDGSSGKWKNQAQAGGGFTIGTPPRRRAVRQCRGEQRHALRDARRRANRGQPVGGRRLYGRQSANRRSRLDPTGHQHDRPVVCHGLY